MIKIITPGTRMTREGRIRGTCNPRGERRHGMTKEEITQLIVDNDLVEDMYDVLHYIIMAKLGNLQRELTKAYTDLRLVRKFADADNFDGVKLVLIEDGEKS